MSNINDQLDATITILLIFESARHVLPETCRADSKINKIVIVASGWSFILLTYVETYRSVIICEIIVHLWIIAQNNKI